ANNYANRLTIGNPSSSAGITLDDFLWRSDPSAVAWVGDIRCYTRMPASDASVQWTPSAASVPTLTGSAGGSDNSTNGSFAQYVPFTATCTGTVGTISLNLNSASTASFKCSIFSNASGAPGTILGSANVLVTGAAGYNTITFPTPVPVTAGTQYWV